MNVCGPRRSTKRLCPWSLTSIAAILLTHVLSGCGQAPNNAVPPPPDVTVSQVTQREVTTFLEHTGTTAALESVEIRARVSGFLDSIKYEPRAKVKVGDLLFVIDPRPYRAKVEQAEAALAAQQATLRIRQIELEKYSSLGFKEAIAELKVEDAKANRDMAKAELERAGANLDTARLDLDYTHVRSPINGRVSRNLVDIGNLVGVSGATLLANVVNDESVYVYFNLTERELLSLVRKSIDKNGAATSEDRQTPVYMGLTDETGHPRSGKLDYTDIKIDQTTGTIQVRAIFPNPDGLLYPGMFARVKLPVEVRSALLVPDTAVMADQAGKYVLVCSDGNVSELRRVRTGQLVEAMRVVEKGLTSRDKLIVTGLQRIRPGVKVNPVNALAESSTTTTAGNKPTTN
jgi:membrane fusion protein, multidrug efflux system